MSEYEFNVAAITKAIHLGIACDELPDWDDDTVTMVATWLASEGIGTAS